MVVVVFCVFWLVSRRYAGPAYLSDEIGYLGHAALLAGYSIDGASSWHAGYSLLLAPLFRIFSDTAQIWQGVMVLNALMWGGTTILLLRVVASLCPNRTASERLVAVAVAALYPTWLTMSGYAYSTTAIVFVFMLSVTFALHVDLRQPWTIIPHSLATGFLYWVHPTGLAVAIASMLALGIVSFPRRQFAALAIHLVLVAVLIAAYTELLHPWLRVTATPLGFAVQEHYLSYADALSGLGEPKLWADTAVGALGQAACLTVSSLGLAVLGVSAFIRLVREDRRLTTPDGVSRTAVPAYVYHLLLLCLVGVILMGSASFSAGGRFRVDHWIYGRYAEGVLLPFLAFGLLARVERKWLQMLAAGTVAVGVLLTVAANPLGYSAMNNSATSFWPQYIVERPHFLL